MPRASALVALTTGLARGASRLLRALRDGWHRLASRSRPEAMPARLEALRKAWPGAPEHWLQYIALKTAAGAPESWPGPRGRRGRGMPEPPAAGPDPDSTNAPPSPAPVAAQHRPSLPPDPPRAVRVRLRSVPAPQPGAPATTPRSGRLARGHSRGTLDPAPLRQPCTPVSTGSAATAHPGHVPPRRPAGTRPPGPALPAVPHSRAEGDVAPDVCVHPPQERGASPLEPVDRQPGTHDGRTQAPARAVRLDERRERPGSERPDTGTPWPRLPASTARPEDADAAVTVEPVAARWQPDAAGPWPPLPAVEYAHGADGPVPAPPARSQTHRPSPPPRPGAGRQDGSAAIASPWPALPTADLRIAPHAPAASGTDWRMRLRREQEAATWSA